MVKVVAHPETKLVITPSTKNPEWGTFRVDSTTTTMENGIVNVSKRSAFIRGKLEVLSGLGLKEGKVLSGKIIKQESFNPFWDTQEPKINPTTQEVVLTNGRQSFIQFIYTEDPNAVDCWVDNMVEEHVDPQGGASEGQEM